MNGFLPVTAEELAERGITQPDFVYVCGDAYVDHPSFGAAIICRILEREGYSVAMLAQPDWKTDRDFMRFGAPRLAFLVSAGNIDSMVAHYTSAKKRRSDDAYSPGCKAGRRPDRAVTVYCKKIRSIYGNDVPILIGGLEASLRRFAHYDYWDDSVHPSVLLESGADILSFGMGEHSMIELANLLNDGVPVSEIRDVRGTCYLCDPSETPFGAAECPSYEQVRDKKEAYAKACRIQYDQQDEVYGKRIIQRHGDKMLVQNPPALSLTQEEFECVKRHAAEGGRVVREVMSGVAEEDYVSLASDIATYHHERWDGAGYPAGLAGEGIPLSARIMAIADVFDALISERCYKQAVSKAQAFEIIRQESGTQFDPQLAAVFWNHREDF